MTEANAPPDGRRRSERPARADGPGESCSHCTVDFQEIHRAFRPRIHRFLVCLVGEADADDLTQEVFVKVDQGLAGFRGESNVSTWIYRIARNVASDRLRSLASSSRLTAELSDKIAAEPRPPAVDQQLIRKDMNDCIRGFVENLPPEYRSVMVLSELKGLSNQQIADVLRLNVGTVKIRLHRARARLREELAAGCSFYRDDRNEFACEPKAEPVSFRPRPPSIGLNDGGGRRQ